VREIEVEGPWYSIDVLMEKAGPYLADAHRAREELSSALAEKDPLQYLEERALASMGPLGTDLRIILNEMRRTDLGR